MDKTLAGVLGALGALTASASAQAMPGNGLEATSYRELLQPIPNAAATLQALEANQAEVELAQLQVFVGRPHHHHHHRYYRPRRFYHHHHHHHHHHRYGYYR